MKRINNYQIILIVSIAALGSSWVFYSSSTPVQDKIKHVIAALSGNNSLQESNQGNHRSGSGRNQEINPKKPTQSDEQSEVLGSRFKMNLQENKLLVAEIIRELEDLSELISRDEYRGCLEEIAISKKLSAAEKADIVNSVSGSIYEGYKQGVYGIFPSLVKESSGNLSESEEFVRHLKDDDYKILALRQIR